MPEPRLAPADAVAGLLAAGAMFVGAVGVVQTPVRIIPAAIVLSLVAVVMADRFRTLAAWSVWLNVAWWLLGMTVAIATGNALY